MKTQINDTEPIARYPYNSVIPYSRRNGSTNLLERVHLPIYAGSITGLPTAEVDYLILASDLQGTIEQAGETILLGEVLPEYLRLVFELEYELTDLSRIGVMLCGDLYARTDKRGGLGDVRKVWRSFNDLFNFVVGVAGNHDDFGQPHERAAFEREDGIHLLHAEIREIAGIQFGGISGVIGRPSKPNRNPLGQHLKDLGALLRNKPHFVLLHEGPDHISPRLQGNEKIRQLIDQHSFSTVCCGHRHWDPTLITTPSGSQVINVDAKCVILKIESDG